MDEDLKVVNHHEGKVKTLHCQIEKMFFEMSKIIENFLPDTHFTWKIDKTTLRYPNPGSSKGRDLTEKNSITSSVLLGQLLKYT